MELEGIGSEKKEEGGEKRGRERETGIRATKQDSKYRDNI